MERLINIYSDGSVREQTVVQPVFNYYRAPHDTERVDMNTEPEDYRYIPNVNPLLRGVVRGSVSSSGKTLPEVYRLYPIHSVVLTEKIQWLWKDINPEISAEKWSTLLDFRLAWCNGTGFGDKSNPKANYVTGSNLGKQPPNFDQVRFCGGAIFRGREDENVVWIETISAFSLPSAEYVLNNSHLWYWGTSVSPRGNIYYINRMGMDGTFKHIRVPIITTKPVYLQKVDLHRLPEGFKPSSTWKYFQ